MMFAPSAASRTAWARPWPRAAPVMKATLPFQWASARRSAAQLSLARVARRNRLQHLDVRRAGQVLADRGEHLGDRRRGAVGLERLGIGPLLDEDEGLAGLVQRVQLAAGFVVHLFDRAGEDVADGVDRFGFDGQRGDDDDGHAGAS